MPELSETQRQWVDLFLGKPSSASSVSASPDRADGSVKRRTRVTIVNVDDLEGNPNLQRDNPNLRHPTPRDMARVIDLDQTKEYEVTADQVREIQKSPDYVDNFKELRAQPDWMELTIDKIEFIYSSGKKYFVEMDAVNHGLNHSAQIFGRKGGIYYPRDASGNTLIDAVNTPHIVGGKEWIDKEIARRKQQREEIAWLVYTFAGAVASLGGAAGGGPHAPPSGGRIPTRVGKPSPGRGAGRSPKPTVSGGGKPPTGGGGGRTGGGSPPKGPPAYPGRRPPSAQALPPRPLPDADMRRGSIQAQRDMKRSHTDSKGVWDQGAFQQNGNLKSSLDDFAAGKKGQSVKKLDVNNRQPEQLHADLVAAGFKHHREPLVAFKRNGQDHYRRRDGSVTTDPKDANNVPHDIYQHPDGGLVRMKPEGDPGGRRPRPQVSKSVVHDPKKGTAFDNEMFKVTNEGDAVPKLPTPEWGMKQAPRGSTGGNENAGYVDTVMTAAHPDLLY